MTNLKKMTIFLFGILLSLSAAFVLCYTENFDENFGKHEHKTNSDMTAACDVARDYVDWATAKAKPSAVVFSEGEPGKSVTACPSVIGLLKERGIAHGSQAVNEAVDVLGHEPYKSVILSASMPVMSKNGTEAVLGASWRAAPLGGEGYLTTMQKNKNGRWVIAKQMHSWVS